MRLRTLFALLVLLLLLPQLAEAGPRAVLRLEASGTLPAVEAGGVATGTFALRSVVRRGGERARLTLDAEGLDATRDAAGRLPQYRVFLVPPGTGAAKNVGRLRVSSRGKGRLRTRGLSRLLPSGVTQFHRVGGSMIEVRRTHPSPATVLRAAVPELAIRGAGASVSTRVVFGRLAALSPQPQSSATFELTLDKHGSGETRNRVAVVASRLQTAAYNVWLINAARTRFVDLGRMAFPARSRTGALHLDSRSAALPGAITALDDFDDGTLEIRRGSQIVLRGFVVPFRDVREPGIAQRRASASGAEEQTPTAAGERARVLVRCGVTVFPRRRSEAFSVRAADLEPSGSPYTVTAVHSSGTRTPLGSFSTRGRARAGVLRVHTDRGGSIPGGGLVRLGRQTVEITNASGTLVVTGTFPPVE